MKNLLKNLRYYKLNTAALCCGLPLLVAAADEPPKKIMFVGDSISCGVGASKPANRFTTVAVDMLNKKAGKKAYVEVNVAVSGSTMTTHPWPYHQASGYPYRLKNVAAVKPDIVVIQHGVNDNAGLCSLGEYVWSYRSFVREVKKLLPNVKIVCMTPSPMKKDDDAYDEWCNQACAAIQEIAAQENTMVAHSNMAFRKRMEFFPDGTHPNDGGYQIMAEALVAAIEENKIQSKNNFDFVIQRPGAYRLCGYMFIVSEEAAAKGNYTVFKNVSVNGWNYRADGPVKVVTTPLTYMQKPECKLSDGRKLDCNYRAYFKDGSWMLPATGGKMITAELTPVKTKK